MPSGDGNFPMAGPAEGFGIRIRNPVRMRSDEAGAEGRMSFQSSDFGVGAGQRAKSASFAMRFLRQAVLYGYVSSRTCANIVRMNRRLQRDGSGSERRRGRKSAELRRLILRFFRIYCVYLHAYRARHTCAREAKPRGRKTACRRKMLTRRILLNNLFFNFNF